MKRLKTESSGEEHQMIETWLNENWRYLIGCGIAIWAIFQISNAINSLAERIWGVRDQLGQLQNSVNCINLSQPFYVRIDTSGRLGIEEPVKVELTKAIEVEMPDPLTVEMTNAVKIENDILPLQIEFGDQLDPIRVAVENHIWPSRVAVDNQALPQMANVDPHALSPKVETADSPSEGDGTEILPECDQEN
jgi:hypothetical protein